MLSSATSVRVFSALLKSIDGHRSLEVVALRDFLSGLIDGVVDFLQIDGGGDIKR